MTLKIGKGSKTDIVKVLRKYRRFIKVHSLHWTTRSEKVRKTNCLRHIFVESDSSRKKKTSNKNRIFIYKHLHSFNWFGTVDCSECSFLLVSG